jgi:hypothetical protein
MEKKNRLTPVITALFWAAAIMLCSYLLLGLGAKSIIINFLIAAATVHILTVSSSLKTDERCKTTL